MSERRKRGEIIYTRVSVTEKLEIEKMAKRAGLNVASFVRFRILDKSISEISSSPPLDRVLLSQLLGQLGEIGSKLNKIAVFFNGSNTIVAESYIRVCDDLCYLKIAVLNAIRSEYR
jgi:hypothetical protein